MAGMSSAALSLMAVLMIAWTLGATWAGFLATFVAVAAITAVLGMRDRRIRAPRGRT
jgi:hypothetical protein